MTSRKKIGKELDKLFTSDDYTHLEVLKRGFAYTRYIEKHSILFIGLNPSHAEEAEGSKSESPFYKLAQKGNGSFERLEWHLRKALEIGNDTPVNTGGR